MVWLLAKYMVQSLFLAGNDTIILDACNTTEERRNEWVGLCDGIGALIWYKVFHTDVATCVKRARAGNRLDLAEVIYEVAKTFEFPHEQLWKL
jgi:predicted kinase